MAERDSRDSETCCWSETIGKLKSRFWLPDDFKLEICSVKSIFIITHVGRRFFFLCSTREFVNRPQSTLKSICGTYLRKDNFYSLSLSFFGITELSIFSHRIRVVLLLAK